MADTTKNEASDDNLDLVDMKKIFVGQIPLDSKDEDLKSFFENICGGTVTDLVVIRKENVKNNFGFFTFDTSHSVDEVILKEKELVFNNATLIVNRAVPKKDSGSVPRIKTKTLFLSNIPETGFSEDELKAYFGEKHDAKYGTVESIQFIKKKDDEGNSLSENKGFGFITVSSEHMADKMSIQHETFEFGGQKLKLRKSDPDRGRGGRGGRGGQRGGRGGFQYGVVLHMVVDMVVMEDTVLVMVNGIITVHMVIILSMVFPQQYVVVVVAVVEDKDTHPIRKIPDFSHLFVYLRNK